MIKPPCFDCTVIQITPFLDAYEKYVSPVFKDLEVQDQGMEESVPGMGPLSGSEGTPSLWVLAWWKRYGRELVI